MDRANKCGRAVLTLIPRHLPVRAAIVHRLVHGHRIGRHSRRINVHRVRCRCTRRPFCQHRGAARGRYDRDRERDEQGKNDFGDLHLYAVDYADPRQLANEPDT